MGQANKRGTYEERRAAAVKRREDAIAKADAKADREHAERCRTNPPRSLPRGGYGMMVLAAAALAGVKQHVVLGGRP